MNYNFYHLKRLYIHLILRYNCVIEIIINSKLHKTKFSRTFINAIGVLHFKEII